MKKRLFVFACIITALSFTSCEVFDPLKIDSAEDLVKIRETIVKQFGEDKELLSLEIGSTDALQNSFRSVHTIYMDKNINKYVKQIYYNDMSKLTDPDVLKIQPKDNKSFALKDIDFAKIAQKAAEALVELTTAKAEYQGFTISNIKLEKKDNFIQTKYSIDMTKKGESVKYKGKMRETTYYTMMATVAADGTITFKEG